MTKTIKKYYINGVLPRIDTGIEIDGGFYFKTVDAPGIFCYDPITQETVTKVRMSFFDNGGAFQTSGTVFHGDNIYFIPIDGKYIEIFNTKTKEIKNVTIDYQITIRGTAVINEYIYLFPEKGCISDVLIFNCVDNQFLEMSDFFGENLRFNAALGVCQVDAIVYVPSIENNSILKIDLVRKIMKKLIFEGPKTYFCSISYIDGCMYYTGDTEYILKCNKEEMEWINIEKRAKAIDECAWPFMFSKIKKWGEYIYFFPVRYNHILRINIESNIIDYIDTNGLGYIWNPLVINESLLYFSINDIRAQVMFSGLINQKGDICDKPIIIFDEEADFLPGGIENHINTLTKFIKMVAEL